GKTVLRDVHSGKNLQTGTDGRRDRRRNVADVLEGPVDAQTHAKIFSCALQMDVAGADRGSFRQNLVDRADRGFFRRLIVLIVVRDVVRLPAAPPEAPVA